MNIYFGPNSAGDKYISVYYHQRNAKYDQNKTRWDIDSTEEYALFNLADESDPKWQSGKYLYSFRNEMKDIIGKSGERIGRFDPGSVENEWHGYPVRKEAIDKVLIERWLTEGLISKSTKQKLIRRVI